MLALYKEISAGVYTQYHEDDSSDGLLSITSTHDGVLGEVVEMKLHVRNDDDTKYYTDIEVLPVSKTSPSDVTGTATGHGVKLSEGATQPTEAEWEAIDYAASISISNIGSAGSGDDNTYRSFWYRVECPAGAPADNKENVVLRLSYVENAV